MATARRIEFESGDFSTASGAYAELDVPGDYEAVLVKVDDYDYRDRGKSYGWIFIYEVETPSGNTVPFNVHLSFGKNARWKIAETYAAHGFDVKEGINNLDPDSLVGDVIGVHIDFGTEKDENGQEVPSAYREIKSLFALADEPEGELEPTDQVLQSDTEQPSDDEPGVL